ncbi:cytochrome P450 monooxygenase CYP539B5 [Hypoxylon sp. NC1633]|nr:cytochrome P450 monooxygenase CYP539B5 [Hypoxylon sp. NC1633]
MLNELSSGHLVAGGALLLAYALAYYAVQRTRHELRIRKIGGVHAPCLTKDPITAIAWFVCAAKSQVRNKTLEHYNSQYKLATPECPDCAEIQITPRERTLLTRDPEHIKAVLSTQFSHFGKGQRFHNLWQPRSLMRLMFTKDRVGDLATFEKGVSLFLTKFPASGETVDIMDLFYRMTLDVTTDFLLGANVDSLSNPQSEFAQAFNEVQRIQMMITIVGPLEVFIPRHRFVMPYIEQALSLPRNELEKLSNSDKHFSFLHSVARCTRNRQVLRDQILVLLLAGRDTTAATLSWAFYELSKYPDKFKKLRDEIINSVGRTRTPTYEDLKKMSYLRCTLNETLRLYPSVPYNMRTALEDTTLPTTPGNPPISVVKGDVVIYSTLAMQRRKDLYPPTSEKFEDPDIFSPSRWENWTPKPWHFVPFNGGPRICVGQNFAMTEMAY